MLHFTNGHSVFARESDIPVIRWEYAQVGHALITSELITD